VHYGANSANINLNGGSTAVQGSFTNTLLDFTSPLNALSASLAGLAANSTVPLQTAMTNHSFAFTQNGATAIIVNVDG
jgi:hypothetical protein